jgi:hypothetical protein
MRPEVRDNYGCTYGKASRSGSCMCWGVSRADGNSFSAKNECQRIEWHFGSGSIGAGNWTRTDTNVVRVEQSARSIEVRHLVSCRFDSVPPMVKPDLSRDRGLSMGR